VREGGGCRKGGGKESEGEGKGGKRHNDFCHSEGEKKAETLPASQSAYQPVSLSVSLQTNQFNHTPPSIPQVDNSLEKKKRAPTKPLLNDLFFLFFHLFSLLSFW
jgi:hypothetical protein